MEIGKFAARMVEHQIGFNENTQNKFVAAAFQCVGGRFNGEIVRLYKSSTPGTREALRKMFFACGWDGKSKLTRAQLTRVVEIDVRENEFEIDGRTARNFEVAFVNPLTNVKVGATIEEEDAFMADLIGAGPDHDPETGEIHDKKSKSEGARA